jgi:3-phytase
MRVAASLLYLLAFASCAAPTGESSALLEPMGRTAKVPNDPDDPAIWIHPSDPSKSLVLGTDKIETAGGLYVFGLDGALRQSMTPLDRPNNVDVEYGFASGAAITDIAVLTERMQHRLRVFAIPPDGGPLRDLAAAGLPVLEGETGDASEPMGIALYKRPRDGAVFAIVAPKSGETSNYLWQYRLDTNSFGRIAATLVRRFGKFSRVGAEPDEIGEIEAVVVDDALGYVYYSDERSAIRKYHADPDHPDADRELAVIGAEGYMGDREGLAIYETGKSTGFLVSSDQVEGRTRVRLYRREGAPGNPHDHTDVRTIVTASDNTDGLEVTSQPLPGFPQGLLVMMNSSDRDFLLYDWRALTAFLRD